MHIIANCPNNFSCIHSRSSSQALSVYLCSHISPYLLPVTLPVGCYITDPLDIPYTRACELWLHLSSLICLFECNKLLPSA